MEEQPAQQDNRFLKGRENFTERLGDVDKDMKHHIIRNMCSTFGEYINKLEHFQCMWAE